MDENDLLDSFLPVGYMYKIISSSVIESSFFTPGDNNFNLEVRVNVKTIDEVKTFLGQFNHNSCCTFKDR